MFAAFPRPDLAVPVLGDNSPSLIAEADSAGVVDEAAETNHTAVLKVVGIQGRRFGVGAHGA